MTRLLTRARDEATRRGGTLRGLRVRLGAMASSDPEHFRRDFEHVREELGFGALDLELELAPEHPAGVELLSVEIAG